MNILSDVFRSVENPETPLSSPADWLVNLFGGLSTSGEKVTPETSLSLPAVWSAVALMSQTLGALPMGMFSNVTGQREQIIHPVGTLLKNKPHDLLTAYQWKQLMMAHVTLWGNGYSLIKRGTDTRPNQLIPYHPTSVTIRFRKNKYWYVFRPDKIARTDKTVVVDSTNVLHFKGLGFDGVKGQSVIASMRDNLGLGISAQKIGAKFYKDGMKLDGAIEVPHAMKDDGIKNLRNSFEKTYNSEGKRLLILDGGMKYHQIGIPPDDSQFIETRKFSVTDIARMFRVPPPLLYDLERATFNNISELILSFVKFSVTPWVVNFEQELSDKLLMESEKENISIKYNLEGLLRGDVKQRAEFYKTLVMNGIMNRNEARAKENMNPYDGGEIFLVPQNLRDATKKVEEPNDN